MVISSDRVRTVKKIVVYFSTPYALRLYLVAALLCGLYLLAEQLDVAVWPEVIHWRYGLLVGTAVIGFWVLFAGVWQHNLRMTVGVPIGFLVALRHSAMLLVGKYLPGKIWGVVARERDLASTGCTSQQVYTATYIEQLLTLHSGAVLGLWALFLIDRPGWWQASLLALSVVSLIIIPQSHRLLMRWLGDGLGSRWQGTARLLDNLSLSVVSYVKLFAGYLLQWLALGSILVTLQLVTTGVWPAGPQLVLLVGVNAIAMIAGFLALFSPGGIGIREGVMVALLTPSLGLSQAMILSIMMRLVMVVADLLIGIGAVIFDHRMKGGRSAANTGV